jgi:hypothetical protein
MLEVGGQRSEIGGLRMEDGEQRTVHRVPCTVISEFFAVSIICSIFAAEMHFSHYLQMKFEGTGRPLFY